MIKLKRILLGAFGVYLFAALSLAQAQNASGLEESSQKSRFGKRIQEIYNQLNLTDEQKKQLEINKKENRESVGGDRKEMRAYRKALQEELMKSEMDVSKINEIHGQIKVLQAQMEDNKLSSILSVRKILTTEQFSKFIDLMRKKKQEYNK